MARPRAADYEDKSRVILEAAAALFAIRGVDGTSMSMIASAATGSKAWLYHYYESKDAIVEDLLGQFLESLLETTIAANNLPDPPEKRFRHLIVDVVSVCNASPGRSALFEISGNLPSASRRRLSRLRNQFIADIEAALVAVEPRLRSNPSRRAAVVQSILGQLNWQHTWWKDNGPLTIEQWGEVVADLVLGGASLVAASGARRSVRAPC